MAGSCVLGTVRVPVKARRSVATDAPAAFTIPVLMRRVLYRLRLWFGEDAVQALQGGLSKAKPDVEAQGVMPGCANAQP
jgi:hypothetical protein